MSSLVLAAALVMAGCSGSGGQESSSQSPTPSSAGSSTPSASGTSSAPVTPLKLKFMLPGDGFVYSPYYIAKNEGYFDKVGLEVEQVASLNSSSAAVNALTLGQTDILAVGAPAILSAVGADRPVKGVAVWAHGPTDTIVLRNEVVERLAKEGVTPESPIEDRVRALKNVKVSAAPPGSTGRIVLYGLLDEYGIDPAEANLPPLVNGTALAAARAGQVEGFLASLADQRTAANEGWGTLWISFPRGDVPAFENFYSSVVSARPDYLTSNSEEVRRFLEATAMAIDLIKQDPAAAQAAVAKAFPDMDPAVFQYTYENSMGIFDAGTAGMVPDETGFTTTLDLYNKTLDAPLDLKFDQVFDASTIQSVVGTSAPTTT